jgi:hypothetical protein
MAATAQQIAKLRMLINEPLDNQHLTYLDTDLAGYIETYPTIDANGNAPDDDDWDGVSFDLNSAAATLWTEKAATLAGNFDFTADNATFNRSQAYAQSMKMARFYNARRQPGTIKAIVSPRPALGGWIGNLAAEDI